ncbi:YiaA/YiaB family inner membrane protein [Pseudonocardia sp. TRM90224]|uniref:YiaA/YiaB family inner membrane protein n=1 Tax=Pseudonocardia sp. TRM90224 TaxID=2812678 RepID=UPI001E486040|nr:YiaA/YiaB family inner membrane protein [Pseudonocardia sp. TRM90224]
MTTKAPQPTSTFAFELQTMISFGVAMLAVAIALWNIPADPWIRGFMAVAVLYLVTSTFTLAKIVRDRQESSSVLSRVDQARLDKLLAEFDPYKVDTPTT